MLDKIMEEVIKEDLNKLRLPITIRTIIYGFVICSAIWPVCIYINSNPQYKSTYLFWLPMLFYLAWIFNVIMIFIIEYKYKNKINMYIKTLTKINNLWGGFFDKIKKADIPDSEKANILKYKEHIDKISECVDYIKETSKEYIDQNVKSIKPELPTLNKQFNADSDS